MNKYYDLSLVKERISGAIPSLNPMFNKDGSIDWVSTANILDFFVQSGAKTILLTYGDSLLSILTDKEVAELNKFAAETVGGRAMVIGCGKIWNFEQNLEFAEYCREIGCDVFIPVFPDWTHSADMNLMAECFKKLGKIMPLMILTNMLNGRGMPVGVYDKLDIDSGVVAIKDDTPMPYGREMGIHIKDKFAYLSGGTKSFFLSHAPYGADGYLSVFARIFPEVSNAFWENYSNGNYKEAMDIVSKYELPLLDFWQSDGKQFDATIRGMYEVAGLGKRYRRAPYSSLNDAQMEQVRDFLQKLGLIK